ncbi:MAG: 3-dehydroquinate synthase [Myxococcales bacterium]|nr:3-dehydroquinate synthase [Myxococcales bacterium]
MPISTATRILRPIFLVGFMATGKSTVGLLLAAKLERRFADLDAVIEEEAHMTIAEIFFNERESGFRAREAAALRRVAAQGPQVIAVGGGAPAHGDNMDFMLHAGKVICLTAGVDELVRRIGDASTRPMLAGKDVRAEVEALMAQRQPYYARAHVAIETTGLVPSAVGKAIVEELEK